jgi:hypothetical protein
MNEINDVSTSKTARMKKMGKTKPEMDISTAGVARKADVFLVFDEA